MAEARRRRLTVDLAGDLGKIEPFKLKRQG